APPGTRGGPRPGRTRRPAETPPRQSRGPRRARGSARRRHARDWGDPFRKCSARPAATWR
ncbi:unnamed protein product, partial [Prorocentrum cordatum]